jgi:hypothetical protein
MHQVVNCHQRAVDWVVGDKVYLNTRNLAVQRPS